MNIAVFYNARGRRCAGGKPKRRRELPARESIETRLAEAVRVRLSELETAAAAASEDVETADDVPFATVLDECLSSFSGM